MSVQSKYFDKKGYHGSPVIPTMKRVAEYDEDGHEFVTYVKEDLLAFQKSNGLVSDWSLDSLLAAGIDPRFNIHTGYNSRIDGLGELDKALAEADRIIAENNEEKK